MREVEDETDPLPCPVVAPGTLSGERTGFFPLEAEVKTYVAGLVAHGAGDYATALQTWWPQANRGFVAAQLSVGDLYFNGTGVPQDYAEAARYYRLAAKQGNPKGQTMLGLMYVSASGVPEDLILAHMWLNLASSSGDAEAVARRDKVESWMSPAQVAEAQSRARACIYSGYQSCD